MFEIYQDRKGEHRFRLTSRNGRILIYSTESYTQKHNAQNAINALETGNYTVEVNTPKRGRYAKKPYLLYKGLNGEELARSENYANVGNVNRARKAIHGYLIPPVGVLPPVEETPEEPQKDILAYPPVAEEVQCGGELGEVDLPYPEAGLPENCPITHDGLDTRNNKVPGFLLALLSAGAIIALIIWWVGYAGR